VAADRNQGRRVVDHLQPQRIAGLAQRHESDAALARSVDLALGVRARADLRGAGATAAAGERRQRLKRGTCAAAMVDQRAKSPRTRYCGANATSNKIDDCLRTGQGKNPAVFPRPGKVGSEYNDFNLSPIWQIGNRPCRTHLRQTRTILPFLISFGCTPI
jgi:hypothetical protein